MESVSHEAWWCKIKITPKVASHPTKPALLAPDEALGECCLLKLLGITMTEFWKVLFECNLEGKRVRSKSSLTGKRLQSSQQGLDSRLCHLNLGGDCHAGSGDRSNT
jgi:hypothetical protein